MLTYTHQSGEYLRCWTTNRDSILFSLVFLCRYVDIPSWPTGTRLLFSEHEGLFRCCIVSCGLRWTVARVSLCYSTLYERACNLWIQLQWSPFFFTVIKFNISASFWCEYKSCWVNADQCRTMKHISDVEIHHHDVSSHTHTHSIIPLQRLLLVSEDSRR